MKDTVPKFSNGNIVMIGARKYRVMGKDEMASKSYGIPHYVCRLMGRKCTDSYPETKMKRLF